MILGADFNVITALPTVIAGVVAERVVYPALETVTFTFTRAPM